MKHLTEEELVERYYGGLAAGGLVIAMNVDLKPVDAGDGTKPGEQHLRMIGVANGFWFREDRSRPTW